MSAAQVHMIQERCWFSQIDFLIEYTSTSDEYLFLSSIIDITSQYCGLVVVALETGGRWSQEAVEFVNAIGGARARSALPLLRGSAFLVEETVDEDVVCVCGRSFANSLVSTRASSVEGQDVLAPDLADLCG